MKRRYAILEPKEQPDGSVVLKVENIIVSEYEEENEYCYLIPEGNKQVRIGAIKTDNDEFIWIAEDNSYQLWENLRGRRDQVLTLTDAFFSQPDRYSLTTSQIDELKVYRQLLRDLPSTNSDPMEIVFPAHPAFFDDHLAELIESLSYY